MPVKKASIYEAKTHFSDLLKDVRRGKRIIIENRGKPVAMLVPLEKEKRRGAGMDEGLGYISEDFDAPLPPDVLKAFNA
jgi:prevent-host-death family protein